MSTSSLERLQSRYGAAIDRQIASHLSRSDGPPGFYGMMSYQLGYVDEALEPAQAKSGKRFRPLLCLLAAEAVGGKAESALVTAAGIEFLHNFSLIHDDIEDRDPFRRYRATVWKVWGEAQAINAGDGMYALAGRVILDGTADCWLALDLARGFQEVCMRLTEGQYMDMSFEHRENVTPAEYMDMIERKTGALIAFSLWSGASIGGADNGTRNALRTFGMEVGRAFQIRDDIMGIWGSPQETGKEAAKDLYNRKKTLPLLLALQGAAPSQKEAVQGFFRGRTDDIEVIFAMLDATEARSLCMSQAAHHLDAGLAALRSASIRDEPRRELEALARELTGQ